MGVHPNISYDSFPKQGDSIGDQVEVRQNGQPALGKIVREDMEDPLRTMVELDDGMVVLDDERDDFTVVEQGDYKDQRAIVMFNYDAERPLEGTIVRDDSEKPFRTVIKLAMGRFVLGSECQYQLNR